MVHGETRIDDYFWLRDKDNPEVARYLEAENAYADLLTRHTSALQEQLYREMVSHIKETDIGVPFREGDFFYYTRTETGKQYPIFCRKRAAKDAVDGNASEEVILDQNALAEGQKFMSLGGESVSEDGNLLAYSTDNTGFREYTLYVAISDRRAPSRAVEKIGSVAWSADNRTLFYTVDDGGTKRHYRVYRHLLGTDPAPGRTPLRGSGRAVQRWVERSRSRAICLSPADRIPRLSGAICVPVAARRMDPDCALACGPGISPRPSRRPVLHSHQQYGPQFSGGDCGGTNARTESWKELMPSPRHDGRRHRSVRPSPRSPRA